MAPGFSEEYCMMMALSVYASHSGTSIRNLSHIYLRLRDAKLLHTKPFGTDNPPSRPPRRLLLTVPPTIPRDIKLQDAGVGILFSASQKSSLPCAQRGPPSSEQRRAGCLCPDAAACGLKTGFRPRHLVQDAQWALPPLSTTHMQSPVLADADGPSASRVIM